MGEPVRLLDGGTATVVALHTLPGVGAMWDLSLDNVHTFAVGDLQAVVHNCPPTDDVIGGGGSGAGASPNGPATDKEIQAAADEFQFGDTPQQYQQYSPDTNWKFDHAEGPDPDRNPEARFHDPAYSMRYYFYFEDLQEGGMRSVSTNFNPDNRDWEWVLMHDSSGR